MCLNLELFGQENCLYISSPNPLQQERAKEPKVLILKPSLDGEGWVRRFKTTLFYI